MTVLIADPWAGEWVTEDEWVDRLYARARYASTIKYRVARRWEGMTTGVWRASAAELLRIADHHAMQPPREDVTAA